MAHGQGGAAAATGAAAAARGSTNRLADEPSPYLRQHADNPVDWWPWGEAAFAEARRRDVPVFLSIGYATCHWCHVMAHESFEDAEVARRMNEAFVNIKVDREERPDIDDVYMAACQMMTGSGGWPLTALLTHAKKPFFTGTYFPKESRYGRIGMMDLVPRVADAWTKQRKELEAQAEHIMLHVSGTPHGHEDEEAGGRTGEAVPTGGGREGSGLGLHTLQSGQAHLAKRFDPQHGGFGGAPKFPSPHHLLFLLRQHHRNKDAESRHLVTTTLDAMARGGVRDHLGGGFHRYSTDTDWLLPHFEKMLYDQAMLAMAYTEAFQLTGDARWRDVARSTLDYILHDLQDPAGGFRCAEDADSEGVEGKFYVWTKQEILAILGPDGERFCRTYGVTAEGNFEDEATHHKTGANILHLPQAISATEDAAFAPSRQRLLVHRSKRIRPLLDDKVLTDWNGLALAAFAKAGRAFGEPRYVQAAVRAATFLRTTMRRPDGRLRHRFHAGRADDVAFLDDHAFLLWGLVELYEATFEPQTLEWATEIGRDLQGHFADPVGGFFGTPADGEDLGVRRKEGYDGAMPSGNSAAAYALHKLGLLTGDAKWTAAADAALAAFARQLGSSPAAFSMMLCALDLAVGPSQEVVIAGHGAEADAMVAAATAGYHPRRVVLRAGPALAKVAPWTAEHKAPAGDARAYVCEGFACKQPMATADALKRFMAGA